MQPQLEPQRVQNASACSPAPKIEPELPYHLWNDSGNADRLAEQYGNDLRYCIERKAFFTWDGRRWHYEDFRAVEILAERTLHYARAGAYKIDDTALREKFLRFINGSMSERGIGAMIRLARKKVQAVSINAFDPNPWDLNVQNGIVDLRTGELRPHDRESMCTKLIQIPYDPDARHELFTAFLMRIMGGGVGASMEAQARAEMLIACLQRLFGCCATAVFEKIVIFFYGRVGDNGKTTLLNIISEALGGSEYSGEILINSLLSHKDTSNATSSDIADLKGRRLVSSSEPEEGAEYALARLKWLAGGGLVRGRHLGENNISFKPTHKLIIDSNNAPVISNSGDAVWNRIRSIPFLVTIPKAEQDPEFMNKLRAELPGVLNWIIVGASWYHNCGLDFPAEVTAMTENLRLENDHFQKFLDDAIVRETGALTPLAAVVTAYDRWTKANGEKLPEKSTLTSRLKQAGFEQSSKPVNLAGKTTRVWKGLKLRDGNPGGASIRPSECAR